MITKNTFIAIIITIAGALPAFAATTPSTFDSAESAAEALKVAALNEDSATMRKIFGEKFVKTIQSGDKTADQYSLHRLGERMTESYKLADKKNGMFIIEVGASAWPFPVPLMQKDGKWYFNTVLGAEEVINRRIGGNELRAINVSEFFVEAQKLYFSKDRDGNGVQEYAQKIMSNPGKRDGLYWESSQNQEVSPFDPIVSKAMDEGYPGKKRSTSAQSTYQGYHYRVLTAQGENAQGGAKNFIASNGLMTDGYGLVSYPSRWGVSGIMTFVVGPNGVVYEKNLGPNTEKLATKLNAFDPDPSWQEVKDVG